MPGLLLLVFSREAKNFCIFFTRYFIHKSFVLCLHVYKVSVLVAVTTICVVSSPVFISANISKPILVSASTVSVISKVNIQGVYVSSVPICRSVCRDQRRAFFN